MTNLIDKLLILVDNPIDVFEETSRLLIKIAENVLKDPSNLKIRTLQKSNATITKKILNVPGGIDVLKVMGFQESGAVFNLPIDAPLNKLELVKNEMLKLKSKPKEMNVEKEETSSPGAIPKSVKQENKTVENVSTEVFKKVVLPSYTSIFTNSFLKQIEHRFHLALMYEDVLLQEKAVNLMPLKELEIRAQDNLRAYNQRIKKEKIEASEVNFQDMLILELLAWFKNDFFEWVDSPSCRKCSGKTRMSHMATEKELLVYTDRVEMYVCNTCETLTAFPRFTDLNILLETRKGRCGEWASTFMLFCRSMGWDTRHVLDETDHVWVEVYSYSQMRWLHCDPCENVCDTPLMYENGWNKKVSYIIAYSCEEVQDVTWRYSSNHKEVLKRRHKCTEQELVDAIVILRTNRQKDLSVSRRDYLRKRVLSELLQLMIESQPTDKDSQGRTSGSMSWRLTRGECQAECNDFIWQFKQQDLANNSLSIQYSASLDVYHHLDGSNKVIKEIQGFQNGIFSNKGIIRYVEQDWKMAYLCRKEGTSEGILTWKFEFQDNKVLNILELTLGMQLYENGKIDVEISNDEDKRQIYNLSANSLLLKEFSGSKSLTMRVIFSGGKGNVSWQHAQLARQPSDCNEFPIKLNFNFK